MLCQSYTVSEDKLVWTFTLRAGITFSDGTTREIAGSNAYPEGWALVYDALLELTGKNVMDARMYAATWMHI